MPETTAIAFDANANPSEDCGAAGPKSADEEPPVEPDGEEGSVEPGSQRELRVLVDRARKGDARAFERPPVYDDVGGGDVAQEIDGIGQGDAVKVHLRQRAIQ